MDLNKQLNEKEAIAFGNSGIWKDWTYKQKAAFQLFQDRLCMPFDVYHEAVEKSLNRPVYTHEFGLNRDGLILELCGEKESPSLEDIINMIPEEKRIVVVV